MAKSSQKGLGKGLGALFAEPAVPETPQQPINLLPIQKLEPNRAQPRQDFDEEALGELAASIAEHGLIQPIAVRAMPNGYYQIIAGERRWRASRLAGLKEVPVTMIEADDRTAAELTLIENLQREDLNPMEEARGYAALISDFGMSQELSVRQTESLVKRLMKPEAEPEPENVLKVDYYRECEKTLSKSLGRGVKIHPGKKKGVFQLEYYGEEDLQQLMDALEALSHK